MVVVPVVIWIAVGVVIALVMIRRGHSPAIWLALSLYGPLLLLLALTARDTEEPGEPEVLDPGDLGPGPLTVVAGLDGSAESLAAVADTLELLGPQLGRLTLATVLDYDIDQVPEPTTRHDRAAIDLQAIAGQVEERTGWRPATVLLTGPPAEALVAHARDEGAHLLVVGSRGHGASRVVLGSVATHLAAGVDIPVLVVPSAAVEP